MKYRNNETILVTMDIFALNFLKVKNCKNSGYDSFLQFLTFKNIKAKISNMWRFVNKTYGSGDLFVYQIKQTNKNLMDILPTKYAPGFIE